MEAFHRSTLSKVQPSLVDQSVRLFSNSPEDRHVLLWNECPNVVPEPLSEVLTERFDISSTWVEASFSYPRLEGIVQLADRSRLE